MKEVAAGIPGMKQSDWMTNQVIQLEDCRMHKSAGWSAGCAKVLNVLAAVQRSNCPG